MSDVLNKASLVLIPSGYKEDKIYSVIPTSGDGDLTFTRASDATRVNSAGLVERVPLNLVSYSEQFDNAYWTKTAATITANSITAPNGTLTADALFETTANSQHNFYGQYTPSIGVSGTVYTILFYAKANGRNKIRMNNGSSALTVEMNLSTGVATQLTGTSTNVMTDVGNGWYRCSMTFTTSSYPQYLAMNTRDDSGNDVFVGDTSKGIYIWGAQANEGTLKPYFPTTDRLNVPRLDYSGGSCPSLLLEPQRTNLALYSEDFTNSFYTRQNGSVTANSTISPDGTQNADLFTLNTNNGEHNIYNPIGISVTANQNYTFSYYVKKGTARYVCAWIYYAGSGGGPYATFDLNTATLVANGASLGTYVSSNITSVGNDWYRISVTGYGNYTGIIMALDIRQAGSLVPGIAFTGAGETAYFWGAQLEASSYPTSYIPTTSSAATRVADAAYKTGISSLIGQTEGAIFWEGKISDVSNQQLCDLNADGNKFIQIYNTLSGSSPTIGLYIQNVSLLLNIGNIATIAYDTNFKFALGYKNNDYVAYFNGVQVYANTTIGVPPTSNFGIGSLSQGNTNANKNINQVLLFKTRLTNSELASLTGNQNYTINQAYASYGVASESPNCVQP